MWFDLLFPVHGYNEYFAQEWVKDYYIFKIRFFQGKLRNHVRMIASPFQVTLKGLNQHETIDYTEVPLTLIEIYSNKLLRARLLTMIMLMLAHCTWYN